MKRSTRRRGGRRGSGAFDRARAGIALACLIVGGCGLDLSVNDAYCESDADCAGEARCVRFEGRDDGLCVAASMDGGSQDGASIDAPTDAGRDGGPTCVDDASCYSGPDGTAGTGPCVSGRVECVDGVAFCRGEVLPAESDATCDGVDDDCDGVPDQDAPALMDCPIAQPGVCAAGRFQCIGAQYVCRPVVEAMGERCNSTDDDCDEVVDEDTDVDCFPAEVTGGCTLGGDGVFSCTGICAAGRLLCEEGAGTCIGARTPASDDGCSVDAPAFDDDCDGTIDEDCAEPCADGATRDCYSGPVSSAGRGRCALGTQTCSAGAFGACVGSVLAALETCANPGGDDDCNGVEDDIAGVGQSCLDEAALGACRQGALECDDASVMRCITATAAPSEVCDGRDDDCDGSVDEAFDLATSEDHCGACNASCGPGRSCCSSACADTGTDVAHCGDCATVCAANEGCCGGGCQDVRSDRENCGACGNVCPGAQECCDGACVDTRADLANCGACGAPCSGGDDACCDGVCAVSTSTACTDCAMDCMGDASTCCAPSCIDIATDPGHCGGCDLACESGNSCCGADGCRDTTVDPLHCGACDATCSGATDTCCDSGCVDTTSDGAHCGGCGIACDAGELCCGGTCVDPASDAGHCGDCTTDCTVTSRPSCTGGVCCFEGETYCAGVDRCIDLATDEDHCGMCDRACGAGQQCCGGACINPLIDEAHCGACGDACTGDADTCCAGGCVDRDVSTSHCGACGNACGAGEACCGTYCANTLTDENNCGGCGPSFACPFLNTCCSGICKGLCT